MPKKMIWIETLFARLPVDGNKIKEQMLVRLLFLFLIWLTGLVVCALDGLSIEYVSNMQIFLALFGSGFIILFGSYMIQKSLTQTVLSVRPLLRVNDSQFKKHLERIEWFSYSFVPVLLIALALFFSSGALNDLAIFFESIHGIWNMSFLFIMNLLSATGLWIGVSIWLTIFLISRQPLEVELSRKTIDRFRGLTNLALGFALFYFLSISFGVIVPLSRTPIVSIVDVFVSPLLVYLAIGVVGILFPFYNIHRALVMLKRQELLNIEEELELLEKQLNEALAEPTRKSSAQSPALIHHLFSLQIKERRVKAAQEWPIDIGFLSKLLGLVLASAAPKILAEISSRLHL